MEMVIGELQVRVQRLERRLRRTQRAAAVLGLAVGAFLAAGFRASPPETQRFTEINVERINVVEPDGRFAVVIANQERLPGGIIDGREIAEHSGINGLIFYNSEGDEAGGLIFHSERNPDGSFKRAYGHLSLDRFESDQVVALRYREDDEERHSGLLITEYERHGIANWAAAMDSIRRLPEAEHGAARRELIRRYRERNDVTRLFVGQEQQTALLDLRDTRGRSRLRLSVDSLDVARLEFLDETGAVVYRLPQP